MSPRIWTTAKVHEIGTGPRFDGRITCWKNHEGKWVIGAETITDGRATGEGGAWAWLREKPDMAEVVRVIKAHRGNMDSASDQLVASYGGHSGYRSASFRPHEAQS